MNTEVVSLFQKLGLTEYESKAISAMVRQDEATAQQISDIAEVPITKIYSVLTSLENQGLIKCTFERPKRFKVLEPSQVVDLILRKRKEEIKDLEKTVAKYVRYLEEEYQNSSPISHKESVWSIPRSLIAEEATSLVGTAKESVFLTMRHLGDEIFQNRSLSNVFWKNAERGVKFQIILSKEHTMNWGKISDSAVKFLASRNTAVRILNDKVLPHNILHIDNKIVGFGLKKNGERVSKALVIENDLVAQSVIDYLSNMWNAAENTENEIRSQAEHIRTMEDMKQYSKEYRKNH